MAKKDARKQFVQARLKALGGEATPELKAKLRQRFNTLTETKQGRTKIAQTVLPSGTASERLELKKSLRPTKTSTTSSTTTTGSTSSNPGYSPGYVPGYVGVPGARVPTPTTPPKSPTTTTIPKSTTSTTIPRSTTTTTTPKTPGTIAGGTVPAGNASSSAVIPSSQKTQVYGDDYMERLALKLEEYNIPVFGRIAGIGRAYDERNNSEFTQKLLAAGLDAFVTGATLGTIKLAGKGVVNKFPTVNPTNQTRLRLEYRQYSKDVKRLQNEKFGAKSGLMGHTTPGGIRAESSVQALQGNLGGPKDYPVRSELRAYPNRKIDFIDDINEAAAAQAPIAPKAPKEKAPKEKAPATTAPKAPATTAPKAPATTAPKASKSPTTTAPKASKSPTTTAPKASKTPSTTVPQSTTPTTVVAGKPGSVYDQYGTRISGRYKDPVLGDPMPIEPKMPRLSKAEQNMWSSSDAMSDYKEALYQWQKLHLKP